MGEELLIMNYGENTYLKPNPGEQLNLFGLPSNESNSNIKPPIIEKLNGVLNVGLQTNNVYCGDTVETMKKIDDKSINLILTSPPYLASIRKDNHKYPGLKTKLKIISPFGNI